MHPWLLPLLRCPGSGTALRLEAGRLHSTSQAYPLLNAIPWLFPSPGLALLEWGTKIQNYVQEETQQIQFAQQQAQQVRSPLTRQRLQAQAQARAHNLAFLQSSLHAFLSYPQAPVLPSSQQIHSYFKLLFRDWCWGSDELAYYTDYVVSHVDAGIRHALVLGSGAGGLSYRLAQRLPAVHWVSLEHNPLLALTADAIMQGQALSLHELSLYPADIEHSTRAWHIQQPALSHGNHQSVLGCFPELPFAAQSFDLIIAPWFLDILELPFADALQALLPQLSAQGSLLFFGPANVHKGHGAEQWTSAEICEAFSQCFTSVSTHQHRLTYLDSPLDAAQRQETLLFAHCQGPRGQGQPVAARTGKRLRVTPEFLQYKALNDTFHKVLAVIETDIEAPALAQRLETDFGFSAQESLHYAELFIRRIAMEIGQ